MSTLMELLEKEIKLYMDSVAVVYDDGYVKQFQTYSQLLKTAEIVSRSHTQIWWHMKNIIDVFLPINLINLHYCGYKIN